MLRVHEIYASVQGESSFAGLPCTFVRLSGCNLRCRWCDTPQAFTEGQQLSLEVVTRRALATATQLVELTGGEPLLQPEALPLMAALADAGRTVLLETSGERDISGVDPRVHRIVDLKAPGSGESTKNRLENLAHLTRRDELKVVLADRVDYEWARGLIRAEHLHERVAHVLFAPVFGELSPATLVKWMLDDALPARLNLPLHKHIWGADSAGV